MSDAAAKQPPSARDIWQEFHWAFFIDTQALILCMKRFGQFYDRGDWPRAAVELEAAAEIMAASGAAMELAGSFPRAAYEREVRVSMTPPNVASDGFSGLMSWEHGVLVAQWRDLRRRFGDLPAALKPAHGRFTAAYRAMAHGHVQVCSKFVSAGSGSLRSEDRDALANLQRFADGRLNMIAPPRRPATRQEAS